MSEKTESELSDIRLSIGARFRDTQYCPLCGSPVVGSKFEFLCGTAATLAEMSFLSGQFLEESPKCRARFLEEAINLVVDEGVAPSDRFMTFAYRPAIQCSSGIDIYWVPVEKHEQPEKLWRYLDALPSRSFLMMNGVGHDGTMHLLYMDGIAEADN